MTLRTLTDRSSSVNATTWAVAFALLCGLLLLAPASALAVKPDDGCLGDANCKHHYDKAIELYQAGRYSAALPEFQNAYGARQMPWLLVNIGRTLHRLGRLKEAITYYERYQRAAPADEVDTRKKVEEYLAQARVLLAQSDPAAATPTPPSTDSPSSAIEDPITAAQKSNAATAPVGDTPKPIYKKWWFWTAIGGGVALVVIVGAAAGAAANRKVIPDDATVYRPMF